MDDKIKEIRDYIMRNDPEGFEDFSQYTTDTLVLKGIIKYYYYEKLKWCGCGSPSDAMRTIAKFLKVASNRDLYFEKGFEDAFGVKRVYDNGLLLCLAYTLDNAGFTDHGTSIFSAWLTTDGEYFLYAIEEAERRKEVNI